MKIKFNNNEYEMKYSFRALMIYENIMGKSFNPQGLTDIIIFFYSTVLANSNNATILYDDFLDWLDENPNELNNFSEWLMDALGLNSFLTPEVKDKKDKKKKKEDSKN